MIKVAPSILAADVLRMGDEVDRMIQAGCDWIHVDIMDGAFVPNLSYGPDLVRKLRKHTQLPLDVHLMINKPEKYVKTFIEAGADILTVHQEAAKDLAALLKTIHELGAKAGVSVKPGTPVSVLGPWLDQIDLVLVMTVEPGFGGQSFMTGMVEKLRSLRKMGYQGLIEVDGGVDLNKLAMLCEAGVDVAVMGTALFASTDPKADIKAAHALKRLSL